MVLHIHGKDENQVQFLLGAPSFFIVHSTKDRACLCVKDGVKSLFVVENLDSLYGDCFAIWYSSNVGSIFFCMKLFIAPVTELVYVLVLETKF